MPRLAPKDTEADKIRDRIAKLTSRESVPDPVNVKIVNSVSSGLVSLDHGLGVGGFAVGRFHSIEGPEGSGKTALALHAVGQHQQVDPKSIHAVVDIEGTLDDDFARMCGANTDPSRFIILRPETAEEACKMCMGLMGYVPDKRLWKRDPEIKPVTSIIYDSWAGSPTEEVGLATLARVGSEWIPKIALTAQRVGTTLFWINQIREKPGVMFGNPEYSPGGRALKHAQSTRLWVHATNRIVDEQKQPIAHDLKVDVQKNKLAPPFHRIYLHLNYATGFDEIVDALSFMERKGVSFKEKEDGNYYTFAYAQENGEEENVRANGREKFLDALRGEPEAAETLIASARALFQKGHA